MASHKYVYLFELDSVRTTDEEILKGQEALYREITANGNTVVLTFNQFADSRGFFSLMKEPSYYDSLIQLFSQGAIRISQFGDIRTPSQYLSRSLENGRYFLYSALPLRFDQKRLTALTRRSLIYSDLSELLAYTNGSVGEEEIRDLFLEVHDGHVQDSSLSLSEMHQVLENLYWFLSGVLRISQMPQIYIPPRDPQEYRGLNLHTVLSRVFSYRNDAFRGYSTAVKIIRNLPAYQAQNNYRSVYLQQLCHTASEQTKDCALAEAIVNAAYNYVNEISIANISRHYDISVFQQTLSTEPFIPDPDSPDGVFYDDFFGRLMQDWQEGLNYQQRYLRAESNRFVPFTEINLVPDMQEAVRTTQYASFQSVEKAPSVSRYEADNHQSEDFHRMLKKAMNKKFLYAFLCILIACVLEVFSDKFKNLFDTQTTFSSILLGIPETIVFLFVAEGLTDFLSAHLSGILSLSDSLQTISHLIRDRMHLSNKQGTTYRNPNPYMQKKTESAACVKPAQFILPSSLRQYNAWLKQPDHSDLFHENSSYPIAPTTDPAVQKQLVRDQELYGFTYGIAYQSRYHTLLVDPVYDQDHHIYPYERITDTNGRDGVVMIPAYQGKYILLKQDRHPIRQTQISFPRGFGEKEDSSSINSAVRELQEELHASVKEEPVHLGTITPDSGLSSSKAQVYLVKLDQYDAQSHTEGIESTICWGADELEQAIHDGIIQDSFTLSAYTLLKNYQQK